MTLQCLWNHTLDWMYRIIQIQYQLQVYCTYVVRSVLQAEEEILQ